MFVIEDEAHAEWHGQFRTRQQALAELQRLAALPWDQEPNRAPCTSWKNCSRRYELIEYDDSVTPWRELSRTLLLEISASGTQWVIET
jgi:hypothetical protein